MDLILSAILIFVAFALIFLAVFLIDIIRAKKHNQKYRFKPMLASFLFLLPAIVLAFFFVVLPIIYSLAYSFTDYNLLKPEQISFNGFANFVKIFKDIASGGMLSHAIQNTLLFVVLVVPLQIGLALGLALFCNVKVKGNFFFKVCFFTPVVISLTITSYLWLEILSPSETGLLNSFLGLFGVAPQDFINNPKMTIIWIVIISAWQGCGYQMLIFLSALSGIRKDLYEAARLDGCNAWQRFLHVTLPGLRPTLLYITITVFIGACRIMVQPMLMVGYQENSVTLSYLMYYEGYSKHYVGYSAAIALIMTIVIGSITLLQRKFLGGKNNG